jgi:hypothetical protein
VSHIGDTGKCYGYQLADGKRRSVSLRFESLLMKMREIFHITARSSATACSEFSYRRRTGLFRQCSEISIAIATTLARIGCLRTAINLGSPVLTQRPLTVNWVVSEVYLLTRNYGAMQSGSARELWKESACGGGGVRFWTKESIPAMFRGTAGALRHDETFSHLRVHLERLATVDEGSYSSALNVSSGGAADIGNELIYVS